MITAVTLLSPHSWLSGMVFGLSARRESWDDETSGPKGSNLSSLQETVHTFAMRIGVSAFLE